MKKKIVEDIKPVTRGILREELSNYPTKVELRQELDDKLQNYPTREEFKEYRCEILSRLDHIVGDLAQMREDRLFVDHDIRELKEIDADHENRIKELEQRKN